MKMIPYDVDTYKHIKPSNNLKILEEFAGSGMKCVKLVGWTQKNAKVCQTSLLNSTKTYNMRHIKIMIRKGEVFLYNTNF